VATVASSTAWGIRGSSHSAAATAASAAVIRGQLGRRLSIVTAFLAGLYRSSVGHISGSAAAEAPVGGTVPAIGLGTGGSLHGGAPSQGPVCRCSFQSAHKRLMNCPWQWVLQVVIESAPPSGARWRSPVLGQLMAAEVVSAALAVSAVRHRSAQYRFVVVCPSRDSRAWRS
jgi:hypothetical protein